MKTKTHIVSALLWLLLSATIASADPSPPPGRALTGNYLLIEHVKDIDALDRIEFHPDGTCKVDYNGSLGVAATYQFGHNGKMTITLDGGQSFTYGMKKQRVSMLLSQDNQQDLYYALLPAVPPAVTFNDLVGIYDTHNSAGNYATEITADHHFFDHIRYLDPQAHTYFDVYTDGACSFANGIVTYLPDRPLGSQTDIFIKDALAKHDTTGLWVIDPYDDVVLLETPAKDLGFPPPPAGYQSVSPP